MNKFLEIYIIRWASLSFRRRWYCNYVWGKDIKKDLAILTDWQRIRERFKVMTDAEFAEFSKAVGVLVASGAKMTEESVDGK